MRGTAQPDQWVIRGNHHDAWVFGADDPISGTVALMEEARAVGELAKRGWAPKRTIVYALWDGEEPGLLGSTEWVETHADRLAQNAAVYVNSDNNGRGFLRAMGSHSLERLVNEVARDVVDPQTRLPVGDRLRAFQLARGTPEEKRAAREDSELRLGALGSGSDYTPFLQHLGIASLDLRYTGENGGGSYHSLYDSFDHYTRFGDPGFDYGIALAQTAGRVVIRCAEAETLPFQFGRLAATVDRYAKEVAKLADDMRAETAEQNRLIREGTLMAAADPRETFIPPAPQAPVPYLNFAPLQNAVARLQDAARAADAALAAVPARNQSLPADQARSLDQALIRAERALTNPGGLPRRPWFRHQVYAPGFYTGYAVKTLPGPREAIEQRKWDEAAEQIPLAAAALTALATELDRVATLAGGQGVSGRALRS
jgi:N-acetylated-alpha-linked acidic dipeptidase